jgi:Predicted thioesterase
MMRYPVTDADTAAVVGSGDVPVLATPRLVAWLEAATVQEAASLLESRQTTVGTAVRIEHHRATPVGGAVEVMAALVGQSDGRRLTFAVDAVDGSGQSVATGEIDRMIVDRERFVRAATSL